VTVGTIAGEPATAGLRLLLSGDVAAPLTTLAGLDGRQLAGWRARQVTHRPGRSTTVQYRVRLVGPGRAPSTATYVLTDHLPPGSTASAASSAEPGIVRHGDLVGWRPQDDPGLPGLALALDPHRVAGWLETVGHPLGPVALRRRAYRPGRRAVVEATGPAGRAFLKVVPAERVDHLAAVHDLLAGAVPTPRRLGHTADGVLAMTALPGTTLRAALTEPPLPSDPLPSLAAVEAVLDALPPLGLPPRGQGALPTVRRHARLLSALLPDQRPVLDRLIDDVADRLVHDHPHVPVHGDLYEAQVLVAPEAPAAVTGLLDLDTVGVGHRVDDVANLLAHLAVLGLRGHPAVPAHLAWLTADAVARFPHADLHARIAARVVGLATGPFRVQTANWPAATRRRLALARTWLERGPRG
jgi:aminoglycoside phosphotransferase (APT) family kinase protein